MRWLSRKQRRSYTDDYDDLTNTFLTNGMRCKTMYLMKGKGLTEIVGLKVS